MNPKTKKYLLIGGAVVAVAAIWWFFGRSKGKSQEIKVDPKKKIAKGAMKQSGLAAKLKANKPADSSQAQTQQ